MDAKIRETAEKIYVENSSDCFSQIRELLGSNDALNNNGSINEAGIVIINNNLGGLAEFSIQAAKVFHQVLGKDLVRVEK
jgi:hypothetical protein